MPRAIARGRAGALAPARFARLIAPTREPERRAHLSCPPHRWFSAPAPVREGAASGNRSRFCSVFILSHFAELQALRRYFFIISCHEIDYSGKNAGFRDRRRPPPRIGSGAADGCGPRAQSPANPISLHAPSHGQAKGGQRSARRGRQARRINADARCVHAVGRAGGEPNETPPNMSPALSAPV